MNVSEGNDTYLSAAIGDVGGVDHQRLQWREYFWITECLACQVQQTSETATLTIKIRCILTHTFDVWRI